MQGLVPCLVRIPLVRKCISHGSLVQRLSEQAYPHPQTLIPKYTNIYIYIHISLSLYVSFVYIYMSPIPFGLMRLGFLSSIINTQANFCYTILIFAYNDRNETTHQTHRIYYILFAIYRIVHTIHYIIYIYTHIWGVSLN